VRNSIFILVVLITSVSVQAQKSPKKIRSKTDYTHKSTGYNFPLSIDQYQRTDIYAFDKKKKNIGINYKTEDSKTVVSIYLYPAGSGTEDRLRNEYLKSINSIANTSNNGINAQQYAVSYKNGNYKINGFKANIKDIQKRSSLSVFECGSWFFKIRLTSSSLDSSRHIQLENKFLDIFNPTKLVEISTLNPKASIYYSKNAFIDSVLLGSAMGSALKKIEWVYDNVDSLERASGFPGLYMEMQVEALKEFVTFEKRFPNYSKREFTEKYLQELNSIIDNGFLEEFVLDQFDMILIVPEGLTVNFDAYELWKKENPISIDLEDKFYIISFNE